MTIDEKELRIMRLKSELFDLQSMMGQIRAKMEENIKELNNLLKEGNINETKDRHSSGS